MLVSGWKIAHHAKQSSKKQYRRAAPSPGNRQ